MTLSRVMIQAADAFEVGQVYVAVSRCVSTDGLWISGGRITDRAVKAHPDVIAFMQPKEGEGKGGGEEEEDFFEDDDATMMLMMDRLEGKTAGSVVVSSGDV